MPLPELEPWLQGRADRHSVAASIPMLDGYVAAIVARPVSIDPLAWNLSAARRRCQCLQSRRYPEFAAICAVARRRNDISRVLSSTPHRFEPMHRRKPNDDVDLRPWCRGFYAAMRLRMSDWAPLLDTSDVNHGLLLPILLHCRDDRGRPLLGATRRGRETREFLRNAHSDIPVVVEAMRQVWMRYARAIATWKPIPVTIKGHTPPSAWINGEHEDFMRMANLIGTRELTGALLRLPSPM